ncbi:hypothetical protein RINTHH_12670 [Richelia intracellularis HH01]|uniref:Uncharacterized protein n=1 Tax=Richelia intracellularis HH01 TaxID=1165094 RepID=M1WZA7_9NOST|nr:hypothetical protein [Richelia intracellularis]CCH67422.1 hypothetical protein RINTHH_12670 [Richelia intracellularis HH01]
MEVKNDQSKTVNIDKNIDKPKSEETNQNPVQAELSNKLDIRQKSALSIRPTKSSELKVVETIDIMGIRPIAANTMNIVDEITASGIRPITASDLVISKKYSLMGNRPIMVKMKDESNSLMGFLD